MTLHRDGTTRLLSKAGFYSNLVRSLALDEDAVQDEAIVWESGIDSALIIELVLVLEDLGLEVPDTVRWDSVTFGELYRVYAVNTIR